MPKLSDKTKAKRAATAPDSGKGKPPFPEPLSDELMATLRRDSAFKKLSPEDAARVVFWCLSEGYRESVRRCADSFGIKTFPGNLKKFTTWFFKARDKAETGDCLREVLLYMRERGGVEPEPVRRLILERLKHSAIVTNDPGLLLKILAEEGRDRERDLSERRVIVLEKAAGGGDEKPGDGGISEASRAAIEAAARLM